MPPVRGGASWRPLLNGDHSNIEVTTDLQTFGLILTAEPYFAVTQPSDVVVLNQGSFAVMRFGAVWYQMPCPDFKSSASTIPAPVDLCGTPLVSSVVHGYQKHLNSVPASRTESES